MRHRQRDQAESNVDDLLAELEERGFERVQLAWSTAGWVASVDGQPRSAMRSPEAALRILLNIVDVGVNSQLHEERRSCWRKEAYHTRQHAEEVRRGIGSGAWLRVYQCPTCAAFHLTKRRPR